MNAMHLEATTIVLRDPVLADLDDLSRWMQPDQDWHRWDGPYYPAPGPDQIRDKIDRFRRQIIADEFPDPRTHLVIADLETNTVLGHVTWYWESAETNWLSVGIGLYDPAMRGEGRGYQALGLWCDYLLTANQQLARIDLRTWSGNPGMIRLALRLGFIEEARFRNARVVEGELYDGLGFGVLREEWTVRYPQGFAASLGVNKPAGDTR